MPQLYYGEVALNSAYISPKTAKILMGLAGAGVVGSALFVYQSQRVNRSVHHGPSKERPDTTVLMDRERNTAWETYLNQKYRFQLRYPKGWFLYDEETWKRDNDRLGCEPSGSMKNTLILSQDDLGSCVAVVLFESWPGDLLVRFYDHPWTRFPYVLGEQGAELMTISGELGVKYTYREDSEGPRKRADRLYFNHQSGGYIIEYRDDNRRLRYEQILSSFKFL